jgi:hypothetical protein
MNFLEVDVGYVVQCFLGSDATNPHLVMQPPQSFLSTMEEYVKDAPRAAPSGTLYLKDVPENEERSLPRIQLTPSSDVKEEVYESASPKAKPLPETAPPPAPPVEPVGDLLVGFFIQSSPRHTS